MSARHLKAQYNKRTFGVLSIFALLAPLFLIAPSVTATGEPSVLAPAPTSFLKSTANQDPGDFVVSGFGEGELLVTVGLVNPPTGTSFSISSTVGAVHSTGYTSWVNLTEVSFKVASSTGKTSQQNANDALASMTVTTGATPGDVEFRVSVMPLTPGVAFNPVTQHAYKAVSDSVLWDEARQLAESEGMAYDGVRGYLATITSEQENNFITVNIPESESIWIGASDAAVEGTWRWVTGPEGLLDGGLGLHFWQGDGNGTRVISGGVERYAAWATGEPNDGNSPTSSQNYALTNWQGPTAKWDDQGTLTSTTNKYLIEYSQETQTFTSLRSASVKIPMLRVTYNANQDQHQKGGTLGAAPIDSSAYLSGATVTVPSSTLTRTGFTFAGWQVSGTNTLYQVGDQFTISSDVSLNAKWEIPKAARLIGLTNNNDVRTETIVPVTNGGALVSGNVRGITNDGDHIYFIPSDKDGFIRQVDFDGTNVVDHAVPLATALDKRDLTYSNGCIFVRKMIGTDTSYKDSDLVCIDTSTWTAVQATVPSAKKFDAGQGWLTGNLVDFPDGRIGAVSNATSTMGSTVNIPNCPAWAYCKTLRLYNVAVDRTKSPIEVGLTWSEDVTLADTDSNWPSDDHGIATDGTYLYQSHHLKGYKVFGLASGSPSYLVFNGDGTGTGATCGANDGVSGFVCSINPNPSSVLAALTNPSQAVINNATYFSRDHVNQRYIMGDYGSPRFLYTESAAPPAGLGSIDPPGSPTGITGSGGNASATVSWTAPATGGPVVKYTVTSNPGGLTCIAFSPATSCEVTGLANGTSYTFSVVAQNGSGASSPSPVSSVVVPAASGGSGAPTSNPGPTPGPTATTAPVSNQPPAASATPSPTPAPAPPPLNGPAVLTPPTNGGTVASVGGELVDPETLPRGSQELDIKVGVVDLTFKIPNGSGGVQDNSGNSQLDVNRDKKVNLTGGGLLPGSSVQVWLPGSSKNTELGRIKVDEDGSFSGDISFGSAQDGSPLPIGAQVIQLTGVDSNGNQTVVSLSVNIAQPDPAPELFRGQTVNPNPGFGNFEASNAGLPERATLTAISDQKRALVEGDGWSLSLQLSGEGSGITENADGVYMTLVRGESVSFGGNGFMPGTIASIWLFSDPMMLGEVTIGADGSFSASTQPLDAAIATGEHTIQIQGVGEDGFIRSANLGVVVAEPVAAAAPFPLIDWLPLGLLGLIAAAGIAAVSFAKRRKRPYVSNVIPIRRAA